MKIWHDDLGLQDDPHETMVLFYPSIGTSLFSRVTRGDCAVAALGPECFGVVYAEWFNSIYLLMLHGF